MYNKEKRDLFRSVMIMETKEPSTIDIIHVLMQSSNYIQREFQSQLAALDSPFHLTGPRIRVLSTVAEKGSIRMNELARILGIKARSVTDFVDALEQDKLLVRQPDPNDRRAILLQLTDLAKTHLNEARVLQNEIADRLLENIPVDQHGVLLDLLKRLNKEKYQATNID